MGFLSRTKIHARRKEFEAEALRHMDTLYATGLRLTRSPAQAEDLVQDTLVKAWRFFDHFEAGTNCKAWLLKIQMNTFINRYRRSTKEQHLIEEVAGQVAAEPVMSRETLRDLLDPHGAALRPLVQAEIQRAVDALPDDYRAIILFADVEELTYKEIADILGCPIGTVMSRLHRARKMLQKHLAEQAAHMGLTGTHDEAEGVGPVSLESYRRRKQRTGADTEMSASAQLRSTAQSSASPCSSGSYGGADE
jgi:RNA polymerase sigma-70 factor, ECF subfamily